MIDSSLPILMMYFHDTIFPYSDGKPVTSIIRRLCNLLSPSVPTSVRQPLFSHCLAALRSFMIGPIAHSASIPQGASVWDPSLSLTKQVVEHEKLPMTLLKILDDNSTVNDNNQELLQSVLRCVCAFSEQHSCCLEGMLRLGFRAKIVLILQQDAILLPLLRTGLAALSVLCGHTHSSCTALPAAVSFSTEELCGILYTQKVIMDAVYMNSDADKIHTDVLINVFTILRYMLPLCSPSDKLFKVCSVLCQL